MNSVEASVATTDTITRKLECVCLRVGAVTSLPQKRVGWESVAVVGGWVIERKRARFYDRPWRARRAWKRRGSGKEIVKFWEFNLMMAIAAEASRRSGELERREPGAA